MSCTATVTRPGQQPAAARLAMLLLLAMAALVASSCDKKSQKPPLEIYGEVPAFSFTTQESKPFTRDDLLGSISIANFIFTRCPTVCPVFSMKMQRIAERTDEEIQLVSFSVDPAYDTPERLAAYASDYDADPRRWHFLTGDPKQVRDTVEGALKIAMAEEGIDGDGVPDIVHGVHFVLIDDLGRIRGYYNADDPERIDQLVADARRLAKQRKKAS